MCYKRKLIDRLRGVQKVGEREFGHEAPSLLPRASLTLLTRLKSSSISNACRAGELIEGNFNAELLCSVC